MPTPPRQLRLRYPSVCASCQIPLANGNLAWWDSALKQAHCLEHPPQLEVEQAGSTSPPRIDPGVAGASAQREFERRRTNREDNIRAKHARLGGLILALTNEPQSTRAWAVGAEGERELAKRFAEVEARGSVSLHDRRIPGSRANIDHIVVAPAGVFVVDAKKYAGKVAKRDVGAFFKKDERLYVGRRDCSKLVAGMQKQLTIVRDTLADEGAASDVPVTGALCFVGAEWSLFARPIQLDGVTIIWPKALVETFERQSLLSADEIAATAQVLSEKLPPA